MLSADKEKGRLELARVGEMEEAWYDGGWMQEEEEEKVGAIGGVGGACCEGE